MGKLTLAIAAKRPPARRMPNWYILIAVVAICRVLISTYNGLLPFHHSSPNHPFTSSASAYGSFPDPHDPFHFLPCTEHTLPPALGDKDAEGSWKKLFDPNPAHWSWGNATTANNDTYAGRGIYLCGYLDVPLDYTNSSDDRIARLAVTKFQVSGPARVGDAAATWPDRPAPGTKSDRTLVIEPGGPGGSGTSFAWRQAEAITKRLSDGQFDVLGWDPRGVNASLPSASCFPFDADRDRWALLSTQYRETVAASPRAQLQVADALAEATFTACWERLGDLGRFVSTASVAKDMEEIRKALGEDELSGYFVSYGTGLGQTFANMFPTSVGRMVLDGTEYVRDHRMVGGFGWTALDNATDAWHDGFLGECLHAGPEHCELAKQKGNDDGPVSLAGLEARMRKMIDSLIYRPIPGYSPTSGPSIITYSALVQAIYSSLYNAASWPALAHMLSDLEDGNSTLATRFLDKWEYDPRNPSCSPLSDPQPPSTKELGSLVICADSADAPEWADAQDLEWWLGLWDDMATKSWISGNSRFYNVFPCRHFNTYWPQPAELYRGHLNNTLSHPVLLIAETHDPATPLRNGRRLLDEMGRNARLVVHHGYGHSSRDRSSCTDSIAREFILTGNVPGEQETNCYADEKPYLYGLGGVMSGAKMDPIGQWKSHLEEMAVLGGIFERGV